METYVIIILKEIDCVKKILEFSMHKKFESDNY